MKSIKSWSIFKSWRTTACGLVCMAMGFWSAHVMYVPTNTVKFNLLYALNGQEALFIVGIALLHARDHKS
jgi:hypothetical protein